MPSRDSPIVSAFPVEVAVRQIYSQHRNLAKVLLAVERQLVVVDAGEEMPDLLPAAGLMKYLREFHHRNHQAAEDQYLFTAMRQRDAPRELFAAAMNDHGLADYKVGALEAALADWLGDPAMPEPLLPALLADYGALKRNHMALEESVVLPAAVEILPATDWEAIAAVFRGHVDPLFDCEPSAELMPLHQLLKAA